MKRALLTVVLLAGCGDDAPPPSAPPPGTATPPPAEVPPEAAPPDDGMACARVIVVAWQGAEHAAATVTRTEDEARARAEELIGRIEGGERFEVVAREASDAASSGPRGGLLGTYARSEWPEVHAAIAPRVFGMRVGEVSEAIRAPYGWVVAERCPIELAHTRHVLIRFTGARNAPEDLTRTRDEARALIDAVRAEALGGADFATLARERSEDGSAERGGDVGTLGRGRMAEAYEMAAFALAENELSTVVETEYGFHVIQRLPL
jgi:peptidyl-prolyl cis-trans isomerase SurA